MGRPPQTSELSLFFKAVKHVLNGILSNYEAEMRGENYISVGGFGPIMHTPHSKLWRRPWPLPGLFRTYLAVQNCKME